MEGRGTRALCDGREGAASGWEDDGRQRGRTAPSENGFYTRDLGVTGLSDEPALLVSGATADVIL